jgi:hypothetical protein
MAIEERDQLGASSQAKEIINAAQSDTRYKPFFAEQGEFAAQLAMTLIDRTNIDPGSVAVIDFGCGGIVPPHINPNASTYPPYFLANLADQGIPKKNLTGIDVGEVVPEFDPLYEHRIANINDLCGDLPSDEFGEDILPGADVTNTVLAKLIQEARERANGGQVIITMNNLFGNIDPTLLTLGTHNEELFFNALGKILKAGDFVIMFDAIQAGRHMVMEVDENGELQRSENFSGDFEYQFEERFPYVAE